jgi:hypothetical protein
VNAWTRRAVRGIVVCALLLALPVTAQAYTVTVHVHGAGAVVETTQAALMNCTVDASHRSEASVTDCVAGTSGGPYSWAWTVTLHAYVPAAAAARGWRFEKWVDSSAGGGQINCDPQAQAGDFTQTDCTFATFENLQTNLYFVDVSGPTDTTITSGPSATTSSTTASFGFNAASDPDTVFECKLDRPGFGGNWATCGGPADKSESYPSLTTNGQYTFSVRGVDPSGNVGNTATRTWTVDTTPPTVAITNGPSDGSSTTATSATFEFSTSDGVLQCSLDGSSWTACTSPTSYSGLTVAQHTFAVRGVDAVGNASSPVQRSWTVTAPISSTTGPDPSSNETSSSSTQQSSSGVAGAGATTPDDPGTPTAGAGAALPLVAGKLTSKWRLSGPGTSVSRLALSGLPRTARISVTCKGKTCPFSSKQLKPTAGKADLAKLFARRKLAAGTVIGIKINAPGTRGKAIAFTVRRRKLPTGGTAIPI